MQDGKQAEHWGVGRTCSASWCSWAFMPGQARQGQARPPRSGRERVTAARPIAQGAPVGMTRASAVAWLWSRRSGYSHRRAGMRSWTAVRRQLRAAAAIKEFTDERSRRSRPVRWACQDLNLGPHPYQQNAGNRCAKRDSRRSHSTVEVEVMCSHRVQLCALPPPSLAAVHTILGSRSQCAAGVLRCSQKVPTGGTSTWASPSHSVRAATGWGPPSCRAQPFGRQFLGLGASIRLAASAGTSEATTVTKSTLPSLRTTCTSPPESTKPDPAGTTCGVQAGSLAR